jgi:copper chaperone NosL
MQRLHPTTRILNAIAVLALLTAFFTPLWQIQLWAPQYPEGLNMKIWINKLSGAFDIINGLNHYIGMAMIREEMFPEFKFMGWLVGGLIALGLLPSLVGSRRWLWAYVVVLALGGLAGLADFYRWGYEYGHNLDPHAAIQVPGMSYQPPLIGYKNLLNFTAFSGPDIGGGIMIGSGFLSGLLLGLEVLFRRRAPAQTSSGASISSAAGAALVSLSFGTLAGCDAGPEPMRYGKDECESCRMLISDQRFGCQIVTKKGRVFKFDDLGCMHAYEKRGSLNEGDIKQRYVGDFNRPNAFIPVERACYLRGAVKSPMGADTPAFATEAERDEVKAKSKTGEPAGWPQISQGL